MTNLAGKTAIVTGGAGGMGRGHALRLAQLGADVAIFDIDLHAAKRYGEELTAEGVEQELTNLGVRALSVEADLSDARSASDAVQQVIDRFGKLDIVVNNAGGAITPIDNSTPSLSSPEDTESLFRVNFLTTINMCQAAARHFGPDGGAIVNIVTIGAEVQDATGRYAMYGAAKAAVLKYSRALAVELGPLGVRVNCISPGLIETHRIRALAAQRNLATTEQAATIPLRRLGQVGDVVDAMEFLVSEKSSYVTGECIRVAGGLGLIAA